MSNLALWSRPAWDTDRWLRDFFGLHPPIGPGLIRDLTGGFNPAAEILKDGDDAVVRIELPGVDVEKDVNVEVDKGRLVIHGEHRDEHAEEQHGRTLREIRYGSFRRSFQLPAHVTGEAISASYDAGVLTVRVAGAYSGRSGAAHRDHQVSSWEVPPIRWGHIGSAGFGVRCPVSRQRASSSLARAASADWKKGPKLIRPTPSGPNEAGSSWSGSAIALTGSGNSVAKRRNVSGVVSPDRVEHVGTGCGGFGAAAPRPGRRGRRRRRPGAGTDRCGR